MKYLFEQKAEVLRNYCLRHFFCYTEDGINCPFYLKGKTPDESECALKNEEGCPCNWSDEYCEEKDLNYDERH